MNEEAESEKSKVYCKHCKYRKREDSTDYCYHPSTRFFIVSYFERQTCSGTLCEKKNANNDCSDFK
jgi:hypothetical protein